MTGEKNPTAHVWRMEPVTDTGITRRIPTYRVQAGSARWMPAAYPARAWAAVQACRRLAQGGFRPDVIHAQVYSAGLPAVLAGRLLRAPVVVTEHATDFPRRTLSPAATWIARAAFAGADRVLPVSRYLQKAIEDYGMRARFEVVPNAIDPDFFRATPAPQATDGLHRLLFVGSLENAHRKGVPCLLEALARVRRERDNWRLDMVGGGPARPDYERMAAELGLADRVVFHGSLNGGEIRERLAACTCLVSASLVETFGVVLAEALASGRPVIATDSGGPAEFITPATGILIPPADPEALAGAIIYMLDHAGEYPPERVSAYASERYSYEIVGRILDEVYRKVLSERRTAS